MPPALITTDYAASSSLNWEIVLNYSEVTRRQVITAYNITIVTIRTKPSEEYWFIKKSVGKKQITCTFEVPVTYSKTKWNFCAMLVDGLGMQSISHCICVKQQPSKGHYGSKVELWSHSCSFCPSLFTPFPCLWLLCWKVLMVSIFHI